MIPGLLYLYICGPSLEPAKYLDDIIQPYMDTNHSLKSADEFLLAIHNRKLDSNQILTSLDVETLFTNVPVEPTIKIILDRVYNHPSLPPPCIEKDDLENLLKICTQETPFRFKDQIFIQSDGVSMGSPLGPCFANFYMSDLESKLLSQNKISNPVKYFRYVDDIFCIFNSALHVRYFMARLQNNSVLKFTQEPMTGNTFSFLDVKLFLNESREITTSVYIKPTDRGVYANFHSHVPMQYKKSVINSLVRRAIKYNSDPELLRVELRRIQQVLANNGYPQKLSDDIIRNKMNSMNNNQTAHKPETVDFYVQFYNLSNFNANKTTLRNMLSSHVKARAPSTEISLIPYYKPRKLSSMFSTRPRVATEDRSNVVYQFSCNEESCNASYYGYTTQTLQNRMKQHRRADSSIHKHYTNDHDKLPPCYDELKGLFKIEFSSNELQTLKVVEAIQIKSVRPYINVKYNELYDVLKLF